MTSLHDVHDYYKKMLELQGKLRKRHDTCISRLRMKYIEYLEEQRIRDERNHKLLGALDRVDNSLSLMTAKTDKLNVLRKQYETYLLRVYANRQNPGSIIGDSGVASQIDEGYFKKNSSVVQFSHQVNQNIPFSTVQFNKKLTNNPSKTEQLLHIQNLPQTRIISSPTTLSNKINVSRRRSEYEENPNSPKDVKNQHLQLSQISLPQIQQSQKDICNNKFVSPLNLENNRNLSDLYLPRSILENVVLNRPFLSQYNKLSTSHMEPIQNAAYPATNEALISENMLQRNLLNIPQSQIASTSAQCQSDIPITQHTLYRDTDLYKNVPRSNFRFSTLGSMPTKITKADSPRRIPAEMSPRSHGQIDYFSNYRPTGHSYNDLKSKEMPTHFFSRDNSLYRNIPNSTSSMTMGRAMHGLSNIPRGNTDLDEETRTTRKLENELDRYINKIRNLHRELDVQSLEEHDYEQNTSGDLLNITLSDDGTDYPTDKVKDERVSQEVAKVLALADDLAFKKPSVSKTELSCDNKNKKINGAVPKNDQNTEDKRMNLNSETRYDVLSDKTFETSARLEKGNINNDVTSHNLELEQSDKNIQDLEKENWNNIEVKNIQDPNGHEEMILQNSADAKVENSKAVAKNHEQQTKEDYILQRAEELEISQQFSHAESLNPWDVKHMIKQVIEVQPDEIDKDLIENNENKETILVNEDEHEKQITETSVILKNEVAANLSREYENAIVEEIDTIEQDTNKNLEITLNTQDLGENNKKEESIQDIPLTSDYIEYKNQRYEDEVDDNKIEINQENKNIEENSQIINIDDIQQEQLPQQNTSHEYYASNEQNVQELDQDTAYRSDVNQEFIEPNQQYDYDQNALCEDNDNQQEYEGYIKDDYDAIIDQNAIKTEDEYLEQSYEQYPADSEQEYIEENQDYHEDKSNVYDENYDTNQINDNETNEEYLMEQYNIVETDQNVINVETDQNVIKIENDQNAVNIETDQDAINVEIDYNADNIDAQDVTENFANNEIEKESINQSNIISDNDQVSIPVERTNQSKKKKDIINSLLDSDTESTIERNISNTESDFDFQ
ncbi:protein PFC0760c-like isoform X2 [Vespa mandarinia]|uniref:protein PFC0760c-like isoform X2 n=1 Tax=Vespa mandarinia TaxID=7446 RepID=UPI00161573FF|nr:protein PFC0760c-like isoform X2 [Vespa mandarinia]